MVSGQVTFLQKNCQRTSPRTSSLGPQTSCQPTQARTSWPTRVGQLVRGPASKVEFGLKLLQDQANCAHTSTVDGTFRRLTTPQQISPVLMSNSLPVLPLGLVHR